MEPKMVVSCLSLIHHVVAYIFTGWPAPERNVPLSARAWDVRLFVLWLRSRRSFRLDSLLDWFCLVQSDLHPSNFHRENVRDPAPGRATPKPVLGLALVSINGRAELS